MYIEIPPSELNNPKTTKELKITKSPEGLYYFESRGLIKFKYSGK